jgi:hypothetical protein
VDLNLTSDERAQLELIALHAAKTPAQALLEAAKFLLEHDTDSWEWMRRNQRGPSHQTFLRDDELDARFARMLRR